MISCALNARLWSRSCVKLESQVSFSCILSFLTPKQVNNFTTNDTAPLAGAGVDYVMIVLALTRVVGSYERL